MITLFSLEEIKKQISMHEVISFDIFDTLLVRDFIDPTDVFSLLRHDNSDQIKQLRVDAEFLAREKKKSELGTSEVTIQEIYEFMPEKMDYVDEINAELTALSVRPIGFELFNYAKSINKKVIVVSDIYYTSDQLKIFLSKNGYNPDYIFSSADVGIGKYEKKLYKHVMDVLQVNPTFIMHLGDNGHSDYYQALSLGIYSVHIPKIYELLFRDARFNLASIASLNNNCNIFDRFVLSQISNFYENGMIKSVAQMFAIQYGSLLVYGFLKWVRESAKKEKINTVLFMARDGYLMQEVYADLYPESSSAVINISRRSILFAALKVDFKWLKSLLHGDGIASVEDVLSGLYFENITEIKEAVVKNNISLGQVVDFSVLNDLFCFFENNRYLISKQIDSEYDGFIAYYNELKLKYGNFALVDVGWGLSSHKAIDQILSMKLPGYYVGLSANAYQNGQIKGYLFDLKVQEDNLWEHVFHSCVELLELPFISNKNQLISYRLVENSVDFIYKKPSSYELARRSVVPDIHSAVFTFCDRVKKYDKFFSTNEIKKSLASVYYELAINPTNLEYYSLGSIVHDRYISAIHPETISVHWRPEKFCSNQLTEFREINSVPLSKVHKLKSLYKNQGFAFTVLWLAKWFKRKFA